MRRTKSQQTLSPSTCAYHNVYKNDFYPPIYAQRSHLDPNPKDPDPDPTNRKGANPVDPVDRDPDPTNRTCPKRQDQKETFTIIIIIIIKRRL